MEAEELLKKVTQLYEDGKYAQVIMAVMNNFLEDLSIAPPEILEKLSWSYYKYNNFGAALEIIMIAENQGHANLNPIRMQVEARVNKNINSALEVLDDGGRDDPKICNLFIIAARNQVHPDIYIEQALGYICGHKESKDISAVHMMNNMGRLYLTVGDPEAALDCWKRAYPRYGEENFHHRAALMFWMAKAYQEIGEITEATRAIEQCQELWRKAINADPSNNSFLDKLSNANKTYQELIELQSELAHL